MSELYDEVVKQSYTSCRRLENIVNGILSKLEDPHYQSSAPMSKQLSLTARAVEVLESITELSQVLKSEGADVKQQDETQQTDPRIPGLLERIRKLKENG